MAWHHSEWNWRSTQSPKHDGRKLLSRSRPTECLLSENDLSRSGVLLRQSSLCREVGHGQHGRFALEMWCRIRREIYVACAWFSTKISRKAARSPTSNLSESAKFRIESAFVGLSTRLLSEKSHWLDSRCSKIWCFCSSGAWTAFLQPATNSFPKSAACSRPSSTFTSCLPSEFTCSRFSTSPVYPRCFQNRSLSSMSTKPFVCEWLSEV